MKDFVLATQPTIGVAFGDWKKTTKSPVCDVLLCDENIWDQWKLQLPDASIGLVRQRLESALTYERKLGPGAFSVNVGVNSWVRRYKDSQTYKSFNYYAAGELQVRYYFLLKRQVRRGLAGNNFSGPYTGVAVNYSFWGYDSEHLTGYSDHRDTRTMSAPLSLGYQQRFFGKLYLDASISYARNLYSSSPVIGRSFSFSPNLKIGFTF